MGFEIPIDTAFPRNRKVVDLMARLKDKQGDIWPLRLWFWAAENARDGVIRVPGRALEVALSWPGRPGQLFQVLKRTGFIEKDGVTIHDWMTGIGRAIQLYEAKKERQRQKYAEKHGLGENDPENETEDERKSSGRIPPILETRDIRDKKEIRVPPTPHNPPGGPTGAPRDERPDHMLSVAYVQSMNPEAARKTLEFSKDWTQFPPDILKALQERAKAAS